MQFAPDQEKAAGEMLCVCKPAGKSAWPDLFPKAGPEILKPTTPEKVADGVIRCIKMNISERTINPLPMKPLFMLQEAIPGIQTTLHKVFGTPVFAEKISLANSETEN